MKSVDQSVLEAFDTMWGLYPEPVLLIHACRDILAVNQRAEELGVTTGIKCHSLYPSERVCPGCLGNKMLKSGQATRKGSLSNQTGRYLDGYWIPVKGEKEVFVHFGNDITDFVKPELLAE
ncbi:hypothetical protein LF599_06635 [Pseudodesulfovibrio thermohalotolerans]|uniref:hypothetical protein n=1 Tax=Pseudodesulfovibrio thermohalotolerans TaxID=2880651 RepID=UPI0022BA0FE8|nr:hypothetical protein [Pseudodesulfovibrio thermohalotolerans]WFS63834.1 hypothetical protein LF599_06635 [Pseudodesulfovibrio thermohalotolerans]